MRCLESIASTMYIHIKLRDREADQGKRMEQISKKSTPNSINNCGEYQK